MQSDKYYSTNDFPEKEISQAWDANEQLQGIAFGQNKWILNTSTKTHYGLQRWATNADFPAEAIKEGWDEGYDIIFLAYVYDRWVVIQAKETGFTDQIWRTSAHFPEKEIEQGKKDGYVITDLSYGVDRWAVVMTKGTGLKSQLIVTASEFPETAVNEGWEKGFDITSMAYGEHKWALIMSEKTGYVTQSWATRNNFEAKLISEKAMAGNDLSIMLYANEMWFFAFTTFPVNVSRESGDGVSHAVSGATTTSPPAEDVPEAVALLEKGKDFSAKEKYDDAIDCFRESIKIDPDSFTAHNCLGVIYDIRGFEREALDCFRKAFNLQSRDSAILSNLICQIIEINAPTSEILEALKATDRHTIQDIKPAITHNNIGYAYAEDGQHETAITYFKKALEIEPDNPIFRQNLKQSENIIGGRSSRTIVSPEPEPAAALETVESLLDELNKMTGLEEIKRDVDALIKFIKIEKKRRDRGFAVGSTTLHTVFAGPPGTGKTTVARLMGRLYKAMGLLKKGHVVEVDRSALVAEFVGHTAPKTNKVIDSALDGILFIDEAYSLTPEFPGNDFGEEAITTLVKRMEDHKHNLIVIVAGYPDEMKRMVNSNPGLQHRFTRYFYFKDYTELQLTDIFKSICTSKRFELTPEAEAKVKRYFEFLYHSKDKNFGNARTAHNLFEEAVRFQSARLGSLDIDKLSDKDLLTLTIEDITISVEDEFDDKHIETLDEIMGDLNSLVGLDEIKQNVHSLVNFIKTQEKLIASGHEADEISLHSVFFGPPGTGKTTVARLIGRIYKALGVLSKGHVVEVSRANLVAEFVGQTAPKTNRVLDSAMHGVLFIDEAYSLASTKGSNDFGKEAVETLLKRMEDERDKFAVIVAGYTAEMQDFISSNTGLESRFSNYFFFTDFTSVQLVEIFNRMVSRKKYKTSPEADVVIADFLNKQYASKTTGFGNGRMVRNFYEKLVKAHSNRIAGKEEISSEELITFDMEDANNAFNMMTSIFAGSAKHDSRRMIGFNK